MHNNLPNIKERILQVADEMELTKARFFKKINITYGNFTGDKKNRPINSDALANILHNYPKINAEWLLTGNGEMLKPTLAIEKTASAPEENINKLPTTNLQKLFQLMEDKISLLEENRRQILEIKHLEDELSVLKGQKAEQKQPRHKHTKDQRATNETHTTTTSAYTPITG